MKGLGVNACKIAIQTLFRSYFQMRDGTALQKMLLADATCFGIGNGAVCRGREEVCHLIQKGLGLYTGSFTLSDEQTECRELALGVYLCTIYADISPELTSGLLDCTNIRITIILTEHDNQFAIAHIHLSSNTQDLDFGEIFNQRTARETFNSYLAVGQASAPAEAVSNTDSLTGLLNQDGFEQKARKLIWGNPDRKYVILRFGVDCFQFINQKYGYDIGDRILRNISKNLRRLCRPGELCARIEGSIFAVLLNYPGSPKEMEALLDRLRSQLLDHELESHFIPGLHIVSGLYLLEPGGHEEIKEILDKAALAYRNAKDNGYGDRFSYYDENSYKKMLYNGTLLETAPNALRNGEFHLFIQPQVNLDTLKPVAGEALVRWINRENITIFPGDFIPLFENNGFIIKMDMYLLEELCRQMRRWLDEGLSPLPIAINQSRRHLQSPTYIDDFCTIVDRYRIPHDLLVFELTESVYVDCGECITELSHQLQKLGFRCAIDDFGSGYASLGLLGLISPDILKLDRSLISDMSRCEKNRIVFEKTLEMAQDANMQVICEGIETKEQLEFLRSLRCSYGQGFYFYRPMPIEDYVDSVLKPLNSQRD